MRRADMVKVRRLVVEAIGDGREVGTIADTPDGPVITYTDGTTTKIPVK